MRATTLLLLLIAISSIFIPMIFSKKFIKQWLCLSGKNFTQGRYWVLLSSIFIHGGPLHLFMNLLVLLFVGYSLEEELSRSTILALFFAGGLIGNILSLTFLPPEISSLGASGAISALVGAAIFIKPLGFIVVPPILIPLPIALVGLAYIGLNLFYFLSGLGPEGINYYAHLGGLACGIFYGFEEAGILRGLLILLLGAAALASIFILLGIG